VIERAVDRYIVHERTRGGYREVYGRCVLRSAGVATPGLDPGQIAGTSWVNATATRNAGGACWPPQRRPATGWESRTRSAHRPSRKDRPSRQGRTCNRSIVRTEADAMVDEVFDSAAVPVSLAIG